MTSTSLTSGGLPTHPRVVSQEEWLKERLALLAEEKAFTRQRDALMQKVRNLPWVRVDKEYTFDAPHGSVTLRDLFGPHSQLVVYHFMFDPTWSQGCKSCSFIAEHYDRLVVHLAHRDISLITISKAPIQKLLEFRARLGWTFPWVSALNTDFGRDFGVSYTDQELAGGQAVYNFTVRAQGMRELPGLSVFAKHPSGEIFHTYSMYARGLENFLTAYQFIDIAPRGRHEEETGGMGWLRHRDRYEDPAFVDPWNERPGVTSPARS